MKINLSSKNKMHRSKGFTLVEVILVLVIAAIIAVLAVPGITRYLDNMRATRQEETVRLLYSAAQNKLTYLSANDPNGAYSEKFLPLFEADSISANGETVRGYGLGAKDKDVLLGLMQKDGADYLQDGKKVPCYSALYTGASPDTNGAKAVRILLEESGLFNVIEKADSCVIDIDPSLRFILRVTYQGVTLDFESIYNDSNVDVPESANTKPVALMLDAPLTNGEKLSVQLSCDSLSTYKTDLSLASFKLSMTIVGQSSGKTFTASLDAKNEYFEPKLTEGVYSADITLDSLDKGFQTLFPGFIAGENIAVTFQLYYVGALPDGKPVTPSAEYTNVANNLFARADGDLTGSGSATANISSGRHLQNLQLADSHIQSVVQSGDIDWNKTQAVYTDRKLTPISNANITSFSGVNGVQHTISNLKIDGTGNAGIFASSGADFAHLRLLNPMVSGSGNAGTIVGELTGGSISDCRAYVTDTANLSSCGVTSTGASAGGLVGAVATGSGATVSGSFAALGSVTAAKSAGGLVGMLAGSVSGCYADTKTITGLRAGGFVGNMADGSVQNCYAVTEVLKADAADGSAAGFAASFSYGSISDSYALVGSILTDGSTGKNRYGFAPAGTASAEDCYYYAAREFHAADGSADAGQKKSKLSDIAAALGGSAWQYDISTGGTADVTQYSHPYEKTGSYAYMAGAAYPGLRVKGLDHYGNWPEPSRKYVIRFAWDIPAEATVDPERPADAADIEDYQAGTTFSLPVVPLNAEDELVYKIVKSGGATESAKFLNWIATDNAGLTITDPTAFTEAQLDQLAAEDSETGDLVVTVRASWDVKIKIIYHRNCSDTSLTEPATIERERGKTARVTNTVQVKDEVFRWKNGDVTMLFLGWSENKNATAPDPKYAPDASFTVPASDLNLYAVWTPAYVVHYEPNKEKANNQVTGNAPDDQLCYAGETVTVADQGTLICSSLDMDQTYEFIGWALDADAVTPDYKVSETFEMPKGDVKLFAVWKQSKNSVKITLLLDDGNWANQTVTLRASGRTTITVPYQPSIQAYKETVEIEDGASIVYQIYVNDQPTGKLVTVTNGKTAEATVEYYTVITRCGLLIDSTAMQYDASSTIHSGDLELSAAAKTAAGIDEHATARIYLEGSVISLTAEAATDYNFDHWSYTKADPDDEEEEEVTVSRDHPLVLTVGGGDYRWPLDLTAKSDAEPITVKYVLVGVNGAAANPRELNKEREDLDASFTKQQDYTLPNSSDAVIVTRNGVALRYGVDFTWDVSTGSLHIDKSIITDNLTVRINGIPRIYDIYYDAYPHADHPGVADPYDQIMADFAKGAADTETYSNFTDPYTKNDVFRQGTQYQDSVINGSAMGNVNCTVNKNGYVTIMPDRYYSLPNRADGSAPVTIWSYDEGDDPANPVYSRLKLSEGEAYTYSYSDPEQDVDYNTGVIVLRAGKIPGKYVVVEAECVPTEYRITLNLTGADGFADAACTKAFDPTETTCTHFDSDPTCIWLKAWRGENGSYSLPEKILVRMNNHVVTEGTDYVYDRSSGKVTILPGRVVGDVAITVVCDEMDATTTVFIYKDGKGWADRDLQLRKGTTVYDTSSAGFHYNNGAYIFPTVAAGTYEIWVDGVQVGKTVTKEDDTKCAGYVYFNTLELTAGAGVSSVSISGSEHVFAGEGTNAQTFLSGAAVTANAVLKDPMNTGFDAWLRGDTRQSVKQNYQITALRSHMLLTGTAAFDTFTLVYRDYDKNVSGGTDFTGVLPGNAPKKHTYGTETKLSTPTREGFTFEGWVVHVEGKDTVLNSLGATDFTRTSCPDFRIVLCARWTAKSNSVYLYPEGGTMDLSSSANEGWVDWNGEYGYYYLSYDTNEARTLPTMTNGGQTLLGYVVTDGANECWAANTVLRPGDSFGSYGNVTLKALWGAAGDLALEVRRNDEDWTRHPLKIELRRGRGTTTDPLFSYELVNGTRFDDSYLSKGTNIAEGAYTVWVNGRASQKTVTILPERKNEDILNLYTVTYYPHADSYSGVLPVDDGYYLRGETFTVMDNSGNLRALNEKGDPAGTLIGWTNNANYGFDGAERYAFGEEVTVDDAISLYALWATGKAGIVEINNKNVNRGAGWNLNTGERLQKGEMPSGTVDLTNGTYLFLSSDFGVEDVGEFGKWEKSAMDNGKAVGEYRYYLLRNNPVSLRFEDMIALNGAWNNDGMTFSTRWLLSYQANGADGGKTPGTQSFDDRSVENAIIADAALTRAGYSFSGWNTKPDGSGTAYAPGALVPMTDNLTLYAQWQGVTYTVIFTDTDGSSILSPMTMTVGTAEVLPDAPAGYETFVGWASAEEPTLLLYPAGKAVQDLSMEADATVVLRAVRTNNPPVTITYNDGHGNAGWKTQSAYSGFKVPLLTDVPVNGTKPFLGWKNSSDNQLYQPGEIITVGGDVTLTAQWGDNVYWVEKDKWYSKLMDAISGVGTNENQNLVFYGNTTETSGITISSNVYITSVGDYTATWNGASSNSCLNVSQNKTLNLGVDSEGNPMSGTLTFDANKKGRVVELPSSGSTLKMYDGMTLTNGYLGANSSEDYNGSGVHVRSSAKFYMYGGTISYCTTSQGRIDDGSGGGGAVHLMAGGFMQMGDLIEITEANREDYPYSSTQTYYRKGGEADGINKNYYIKADNVTAANYSDGTYAIVTGTPVITHCETAKGDGGAICCANLHQDSLLLYSGTISENKAGTKGGGIRTDSKDDGDNGNANVYLRIYEVQICYNEAPRGGGLFQWQGTLLVMNSDIYGNQAQKGGGIFIDCYKSGERSLMEFYNGRIHDNVATNGSGGGIYLGGGSGSSSGASEGSGNGNGFTAMTFHDGSLYNNRASTNGGGIHVGRNGAVCTIDGGNLYDNVAGSDIVDIYVDNNNTYTSNTVKSGTYEIVTNGTFNGHESFLLSTNKSLSESLNTSEAAADKQIVLKFSDGKSGNTILQYATVSWGATYSNSHTKTAITNVALAQAWKDASCFKYGNLAIKPASDSAQGSLILAQGYLLTYGNGGDSGVTGIPEFSRYYASGATVAVTDAIPKKNYSQFTGWVSSVNGAKGPYLYPKTFTMPAANVTLTPKWETGVELHYLPNIPSGYTGSETPTVPEDLDYHMSGDEIQLDFTSTPKLEGYLFLGWDTNKDAAKPAYTAEGTDHITASGSSINLYAIWAKVGFVVYDPNFTVGEQKPHMPTDENQYRSGDSVTVLFSDSEGFTPQRSGCNFLGWALSPDAASPVYTKDGVRSFLAGDGQVILYAVWEPGYKVIYRDYRDGIVWKETVFDYHAYSEGEIVQVVQDLPMTREGYQFLGWSPEQLASAPLFPAGGGGQAFQIGASDYYLYAVWQQLFKVEYYDLIGGTLQLSYTGYAAPDEAVDLGVEPVDVMLPFVGWAELDDPGQRVLDGMIARSDVKLIAVYDAVTVTLVYNDTHTPNGMALVNTDGKLSESSLTPPDWTGHVFRGWYTDPECTHLFDEDSIVSEDMTLYGKWVVEKVNVTFNANGGTGTMTGQEVHPGDKLKAKQFTRVGHRYTGWNTRADGSGVFFSDQMTMSDAALSALAESPTLYAMWETQSYTVEFQDGFGNKIGEYTGVYGEAFPSDQIPADPTATYYVFRGWDNPIPTTIPAEHTVLTATWEGIEVHVSFNTNGGSGTTTEKTVRYDAAYGTLPSPTRSGYEFDGWYTTLDGDERITANTIVTNPTAHTLYAHWSETCVAEGTMISMADGTLIPVEEIQVGDLILTYDFYEGCVKAYPVFSIERQYDVMMDEVAVTLDNGSRILTLGGQAFFDMDARTYFVVNSDEPEQHLGKRVMVLDGETVTAASIIDISITRAKHDSFEIITAYANNFFGDGILSCEPYILCNIFFEIDENFKVDEEKMLMDIETYGLFTSKDLMGIVNEEEFEVYRGKYMKIGLGKGIFTVDYMNESAGILRSEYWEKEEIEEKQNSAD